jgi:aminoglycoside phosphotransferase (APT) family kinase protein
MPASMRWLRAREADVTSSIDRQAAFSGTKEVAPALTLDVARLGAFLAARLPGFEGPLAVHQFKGGQSNPTYLLETGTQRYVLRRKPPGKLLRSAHAVDREFRVIAALHAQGFPVAAPLIYCEDEGVVGTPFYIMGHVEGRVVWEPHMPEADPSERAAVYDAMNAGLARCIRSIRPRSAWPISAAARATWRARSSAGPNNIARPRPIRSMKWNG